MGASDSAGSKRQVRNDDGRLIATVTGRQVRAAT